MEITKFIDAMSKALGIACEELEASFEAFLVDEFNEKLQAQ